MNFMKLRFRFQLLTITTLFIFPTTQTIALLPCKTDENVIQIHQISKEEGLEDVFSTKKARKRDGRGFDVA